MKKFEKLLIDEYSVNYISELVDFLYNYKWIYQSSNTQYVKENVLIENQKFLNLFESVNLNEIIKHKELKSDYPDELQTLIERVNYFKIQFDEMTDEFQCINLQNKMSIKKCYEIQNIGKIINKNGRDVDVFVDLGRFLTNY